MAGGTVRAERVHATREAILAAAERLFAEHGLIAVSNRQISEAAGQGNTAAVGYHFGTKTELIRAIVRRHTDDIERIRARMVAEAAGSANARDWVDCLVRPNIEHLASLGSPSWFARFGAQVMTDPELRAVMAEDSLSRPMLRQAVDGLNRCIPELPPEVRAERDEMIRQLLVHMTAERERALADGTPTARSSWQDAATGLTDAIVGLLLAPVTPDRDDSKENDDESVR
ncbi:TetR/AcrR family transcriptional regulator [Actinoallomurus sp. NPDC052274]|uniref:TetR/AcrR family transcriptional regulator n=1 Tax=Actinoallomurus sp. NPDC052274 TaxID=3155420 RepID=UPI00341FC97C